MKVSRRSALGLFGAGALASAAPARTGAGARFTHGVASGDPRADGILLWTRALPANGSERAALRWHVAAQPDAAPLRSGRVETLAANDHCAKPEIHGLRPARDYHYWFETEEGVRSPTGRFRTLPRGRTSDVVLGVVSCQLHGGGLFNAYEALAASERLDAIVHLGDYIYEYGKGGYGAATAARLGREPDPPHELLTLADYRRRHAQTRSDPDLQAAHARAAFIAVWDDHETANDCWAEGAENHDPATEGSWRARKAAALKAYFEWMPIREPRRGGLDAINRRFDFGDVASLIMVETRLLGRSEQAAYKGGAPNAADYARLLAERDRPERELLGRSQARWLEDELRGSVRAGQRWQVIGNQVTMARVAGPDLERTMGSARFETALARLPAALRPRIRASIAAYRAGIPLNLDAWDGYPAARERLYASFRRAGATPLVLTGDTHSFWANRLKDSGGRAVGNEVGTTSITSPSWGDALAGVDLGAAIAAVNEEVLFCDQNSKGYVLLTLSRERARADYHAVSTILSKPFETRRVASYAASPGGALARA